MLKIESYEKIKVAKVSWDSTGRPEKNTINVRIDKARFQDIINFDPPIVRILSHPQIRMRHLMNKGYDKRLIDRVHHIALFLGKTHIAVIS